MMDEISILHETFDDDVTTSPSPEAEQRARHALQNRITAPAPVRRRLSWWLSIPVAATAAAVVAVVVAGNVNGKGAPGPTTAGPALSAAPVAALPYLKPVSAAQVLENAAWTAEQEAWVNPAPTQFMYVETLEMRNKPGYEQKHPNGTLLPGKAEYRTIQEWNRIDGQVWASKRNGKLEVNHQGQNGGWKAFVPWSQVVKLTSSAVIDAYLEHPEGGVTAEPWALAGQYVLPPDVKAAIFRYLAQQPGVQVNPDAVNLDGRPAIALGEVIEGYLSRELLFDKDTYSLIGDRLVAVNDETAPNSSHHKKGDLLRQVIYRKMIIVDKAGDTD
ncbi:CU044_5270 family protein [Actinoplanes sp. NPDC026619]|uniref:CU044_5270 family protein n=1 Tax=Actinoplanes sp. NPDC026619 TaxID=3155798 RepID=UPI0034075609